MNEYQIYLHRLLEDRRDAFEGHYSMSDFAAWLGVNRANVYKWLKGERRPTVEMAEKVHEHTGGAVDVVLLLGISECVNVEKEQAGSNARRKT